MNQYAERNDTLLVAKLREGNKFAFEALYEKYSARLYNTIVLLVYDKSLAKDITQSSFMTIWENAVIWIPRKVFRHIYAPSHATWYTKKPNEDYYTTNL